MVQVTLSLSNRIRRHPVITSLSKNVGNYTEKAFRKADEVEDGEQLIIEEMNPSNAFFITITSDNVPNHPSSEYERKHVEEARERRRAEHQEL